MEIAMHTFPATHVCPAYDAPAVIVGRVFQPVSSFDGRPVYIADSVRVRNPRGGMMTRIILRFVDEAGGGLTVSATEWARKTKPLTPAEESAS